MRVGLDQPRRGLHETAGAQSLTHPVRRCAILRETVLVTPCTSERNALETHDSSGHVELEPVK